MFDQSSLVVLDVVYDVVSSLGVCWKGQSESMFEKFWRVNTTVIVQSIAGLEIN